MKYQSSIYGISQFRQARTLVKKILWLMFLLIGVTACSYQIFKFLRVYFTYPVALSLQDKQRSVLDFPAVTICNMNRMKHHFKNCKNTDIADRGCIPKRAQHKPKKLPSGMKLSERRYILSCDDFRTGTFSDQRIALINFIRWYMGMEPKNQRAVGDRPNELIRYCAFDGNKCSLENFTYFRSLKYGNCYTFNRLNLNSEKPLRTSSIGYNSGLELVLDVERGQYVKYTTSIGAHVLIHDPREIPITDDSGVNIGTGYDASIALKQVVIHRLPSPYRDQCRDYRSTGIHRNSDECLKDCLQRKNFEVCGCIDPTVTSRLNQTSCSIKLEKDVCCLDEVQNDIVYGEQSCDCPLACYSKYYEYQLSKAVWPSKEFIGFKQAETPRENLMFFRHNSIRLKVFFSSLVSKEYVQVPMFDSSEVFSNLGGQLGMWMGFSLFAFYELMEILLHLCNKKLFRPSME